MRILNILNGDLALGPFRESGLPGETLVWREVYTEGPLGTGSEDPEHFRHLRARYLAEIVPEYTEEQLLRALERMDEALLSLTAGDRLRIWADACMFDQGMVARVLFITALLDRNRRPEVELLEEDAVFSDAALFRDLDRRGVLLTQEQVDSGKDLWKAYATHTSALPVSPVFRFMKEGLERHAAEKPSGGGMGRTARRILELARKECSPLELFRNLAEMERYPWQGDSSLWRRVDSLAEAGLLRVTDSAGKTVKLSGVTREILAGCRIVRPGAFAADEENSRV